MDITEVADEEHRAMTNVATEKQQAVVRCQFCFSWNSIDAAKAENRPKCGKCGKPILLDRPIHLSDETFQRTLRESDIPVLVDFYADWCAPCRIMAPVVDQLAAKYVGRALVAKLDTDKSPESAQPYRITGIPTVIVFQRGKEVARQSGAVPLAVLEQLLAKAGSE
jgi:thioredoxin 2